ncbi:MAG: hypothetical protein FWH00_03920, partial [Oscillospiraceae bacterium]|nr:hypothetical protein [Oscillospiraceae bacterium]
MLGFMVAAVYTVGAGSLFSQGLSLLTVPIQRVSAGISDSVAEFFQRYSNSSTLYDENRLLREERSRLLA